MRLFKIYAIACLSIAAMSANAQQNVTAAVPAKKSTVKAEKTFIVHERGVMLTRATFRKEPKAAGNVIEIEALNITGGSISLGRGGGNASQSVLPPANISNIISVQGNYQATRDVNKSGRGIVMQLLDVVYPYRGRITVSEQVFEFEITEPGFWRINLGVTQ